MILPVRAVTIVASIGIGLATSIAFAQSRPAIEGDPAFTLAYFKAFLESCSKEVHGNPDIGKIACSCAAAVIADRFTIEELSKLQSGGIGAYDQVHPGTSKLVGLCGEAARAYVNR